MILRHKGCGREFNDRRVSGQEGLPRIGDVIDNGGQYYHTVEKIQWQTSGLGLFSRQKLEPVIYLCEHDRAEEAMDGYA